MIGILQILGGLALFMFGIRLLSAGMEKLAGEKIQLWLGKVTESRLRSAGFGALATAFLQSSGLLMVTMIGLINANLMTVQQSIGIMLGQEIGTTITAQIVVFDIGAFRLLFVIAGFIFIECFENRDWKKYGEIMMGLGLIFVGMSYMSSSLDELMEIPAFSKLLVTMGQCPFIGVFAGLVVTAITQSSTAVTSMAVAMGMNHAITLEGAIGIILGANIGSCITGFVASFGQARTARQASIAQILINVFGVFLFLPFIEQYTSLVAYTSNELPRQIANAHTIFNVVCSALLVPFVKQIAQLSAWLTPVSRIPEKTKVTAFIDEMQYSVPSVALSEAARELTRVGDITAQMVNDGCAALIHLDKNKIKSVLSQEEGQVDPIDKELTHFINMLMNKDLTRAQQQRCFQIKNLLTDIERVGDMAEDLVEYAQERIENKVDFTAPAIEDLKHLWEHAHRTYVLGIQAFSESDTEKAGQVCRLESEFDRLYGQARRAHIHRLEEGGCQPQADVIFTETLRILERISDHAENLAVSVSRSIAEKATQKAS
ncbi:MAG: Na/Pi cotransporter family protein [Kiritimatiellae bacterium]|nr:Na/Pi cotransporter family protein [Kiritimatiellia bacterium]